MRTVREIAPAAIAVYLFGSAASGTNRPDSDVDVAILLTESLDPVTRFDMQERLASVLARPVDLVDLRSASTVMAMQVITTGRVLHESDPSARGLFEDRVFGAYVRLNEERRGILDRVAAEGTVYGR